MIQACILQTKFEVYSKSLNENRKRSYIKFITIERSSKNNLNPKDNGRRSGSANHFSRRPALPTRRMAQFHITTMTGLWSLIPCERTLLWVVLENCATFEPSGQRKSYTDFGENRKTKLLSLIELHHFGNINFATKDL